MKNYLGEHPAAVLLGDVVGDPALPDRRQGERHEAPSALQEVPTQQKAERVHRELRGGPVPLLLGGQVQDAQASHLFVC